MKRTVKNLLRIGGGCMLGLLGLALGQEARGADATISIRIVPELTIAGTIGSSNAIQYVDALKGTNNWVTLTNLVLKSKTTVFYDTTAPASENRFYRIVNLGGGSDTNQPAGGPDNMAWISSGPFLMGSPDTDPARTDLEIPQHQVTLTYGFWIGKYEVTQGQYQNITGNNPSDSTDNPLLPVDSVTWNEAANYCVLLTASERNAGRLPAGYAYRLPTEAEWECAARAGKTTRFSYGDDIDYGLLDNYGWSTQNSADDTHPVGQKTANAWGLYDMYGNVAEWCHDWFEMYPPDAQVNPVGPASGSDRVYRGGSWADAPQDCRTAARGGLDPDSRLSSFGFRVVLAPAK